MNRHARSMSMTNIAPLSRKEVAHYLATEVPSWRWKPGQRIIFPPRTGGCGAICVPNTATLVYGDVKDRMNEVWSYLDVPEGSVPDLEDPSTKGWLWQFVQDKFGPNCYILRENRGYMILSPCDEPTPVCIVSETLGMPSAVHAMVYALTLEDG